MGESILVLGGARSGKSRHAQDLAAALSNLVLFVATAQALDDEMALRIENHRRARPRSWRTVEERIDIGAAIRRHVIDEQVVIVDCVTLLVSNIIGRCTDDSGQVVASEAEQTLARETEDLVSCMRELDPTFILVSNEVGLGLVPGNRLGRIYRDLLGTANQRLAAHADRVLLMVAGLPLAINGDLGT